MEMLGGEPVTNSLMQIYDRIGRSFHGQHCAPLTIESLEGLLMAVESLDVADEESAIARSQLRKAIRYLQCGECGAAEFELSLAARVLRKKLGT